MIDDEREVTIIEKERLYKKRLARSKVKTLKKRFVAAQDRPLTAKEEQEFFDFWNKYSFMYEPDMDTCLICTNRSGNFDPRYISFGLIRGPLSDVFYNKEYSTALCDKNYFDKIVTEFKQPKTIVRRIDGFYLTSDYQAITQSKAISCVRSYLDENNECVIKPTKYAATSKGKGIDFVEKMVDTVDLSKKLKSSKNFIIQESVKQHKILNDINSTAVLTMRVTSVVFETKIHILASTLRMGANTRVDNFSQGGLICSIDENGVCGSFAYDLTGQKHYIHPNGTKFVGLEIPNFDKVIDKIKKTHRTIPQIWCIGWDIAIDLEGEPIFLEYNPRPSFRMHQLLGVPIFGDLTEKILDYALENYYIDRSNKDYDFYEFHDYIKITSYAGNEKRVMIPDKINGKPVKEIIGKAFARNSNIERIVVSDSVVKIGSFAFSYCRNLKSVILPNKLARISHGLCKGSKSLEIVEIPISVQKIEVSAFEIDRDITFNCLEKSYAAKFAKEYNFKIV